MRDPYTPPEAPPKHQNTIKRPASATWALVLCVLWIAAAYPVYMFSYSTGRVDWLLGVIVVASVLAIALSFIAPRSPWRKRALVAVFTLNMLRLAQTFLATLKHDPSNITIPRAGVWLVLSILFFWGILNLLTGTVALRYFRNSGSSVKQQRSTEPV